MITLTLNIDTQAAGSNEIGGLLYGGMILQTVGWLNLKWSDFSAQTAAGELGLSDVRWKGTHDDTPSHLSLLVFYPHHTFPEIESRLKVSQSVMDYTLV